jgi:hypothetical protein
VTTAELTSTDLAEHVTSTLTALQKSLNALPADDTLTTPRAVEANFVRRNTLTATISRLRIDLRELQLVEPKVTVITDWLTTLRECQRDLESRLAAAEDADRTSGQHSRVTESLRHSLRDVVNGPEIVNGGEFTTDVLVQWLLDKNVQPMFGERGLFAGRGGLRNAESRIEALRQEVAEARAQVERTLHAANQLI